MDIETVKRQIKNEINSHIKELRQKVIQAELLDIFYQDLSFDNLNHMKGIAEILIVNQNEYKQVETFYSSLFQYK